MVLDEIFDSSEKIFHSFDEHDEPDTRIDQSPSQVVQSKLIDVLPRGIAVPVSCLHANRFVNRYSTSSRI